MFYFVEQLRMLLVGLLAGSVNPCPPPEFLTLFGLALAFVRKWRK